MHAIVHAVGLRKTHCSGSIGTPALRDVSFSIARGSFTAVVGPSGCGKSTLLGLLGGIDRVDSGMLLVEGFDLGRASRGELVSYRRSMVGIVFQSFNLLPSLTALENVESGLELPGVRSADRRRRSRELLDRVGLARLADRFPTQLSGGEQQRVAIARALVREPRLLLADEPTGSLDEESGEIVLTAMQDLQRDLGTTCVVDTHQASLAERADAVIHLRDGRLVPATGDVPSGIRLAS
jgi:ABC-type lipoprotein export system ATPase subunit